MQMGNLILLTLVLILSQAIIFSVIGYLTLRCRLQPYYTQFHEITLMKLLYFYDPQACGRVFFYNYTAYISADKTTSTVIWPIINDAASNFRCKIQLWLCLHLFWLLFYIIYVAINQKTWGFFVGMLPFCAIGASLMIVDIAHVVLFLKDTEFTNTEAEILNFIDGEEFHVKEIALKETFTIFDGMKRKKPDDTSWITLLMAYLSCRCVVGWIINFWVIKDNLLEGYSFHKKVCLEILREASPKKQGKHKKSFFSQV